MGPARQLVTPDGLRRPAGFKTGTTNDFRDVSGFGYVPGSLTTGVWMGNNNQEPLSNEISGGPLQRRWPALPVAGVHAARAQQPVGLERAGAGAQTSFDQPEGIVTAQVCRWSGMAATNNCGQIITLPFLEGTVPPLDNVHFRGCLDLEAVHRAVDPDAPEQLAHRGRHVVGPAGERPDRLAR